MNMTQRNPKGRYGLFVLAVIMGLSGIVVGGIWFNNFMVSSLGLLMCVIGAYLIKVSKVRGLMDVMGLRNTSSQSLDARAPKRPGRLAWGVGVASAAALGISYFYFRRDALDGHNQTWTVYAFAASALICAVVWPYLVSIFLYGAKRGAKRDGDN